MNDPLLEFRIVMMAIVFLLTFFFVFYLYQKEVEETGIEWKVIYLNIYKKIIQLSYQIIVYINILQVTTNEQVQTKEECR